MTATGVGTASATQGSGGNLRWEFETDDTVFSSPTIVDGTVYVASRDSTLYAIDAEAGEIDWTFTQPVNIIDSTPTVVDGTVYVGSHDQTLYAVDADSGEQVWAFTDPEDVVLSSPTVADGRVYVGSRDTDLYAIDADTGEKAWDFPGPEDVIFSSPTVVDGIVYVGSYDGTLYAVDAASGDEIWTFSEPTDVVYSSPTVVGGTLFVGSWDGTLYAVDATSGNQEWAFANPDGQIWSTPTVARGTVYFGAVDGTLYAVDANSGAREWTFDELSPVTISSPTVAGETVYIGTGQQVENEDGTVTETDGTLHAIDSASGNQQWTFDQPSGVISSAPTVVDGTVYVGSNDGTLYAVNTGTDASSEGSRVLLGTLGHHGDSHPGQAVEMTGAGEESGDDGTEESEATGQQASESTDQSEDGFLTTQLIALGGGSGIAAVLGGYVLFRRLGGDAESGVSTETKSTFSEADTAYAETTNSPNTGGKQSEPLAETNQESGSKHASAETAPSVETAATASPGEPDDSVSIPEAESTSKSSGEGSQPTETTAQSAGTETRSDEATDKESAETDTGVDSTESARPVASTESAASHTEETTAQEKRETTSAITKRDTEATERDDDVSKHTTSAITRRDSTVEDDNSVSSTGDTTAAITRLATTQRAEDDAVPAGSGTTSAITKRESTETQHEPVPLQRETTPAITKREVDGSGPATSTQRDTTSAITRRGPTTGESESSNGPERETTPAITARKSTATETDKRVPADNRDTTSAITRRADRASDGAAATSDERTSAITRRAESDNPKASSVADRETTPAITKRETAGGSMDDSSSDEEPPLETVTTSAITARNSPVGERDTDQQAKPTEADSSEAAAEPAEIPQWLPDNRDERPELERCVAVLEKLVEQFRLNGLITYRGWHSEEKRVVTVYALSAEVADEETRAAFERAASDWYDKHADTTAVSLLDGGNEPQPWLAAEYFEDAQTLTEFADSSVEQIVAVIGDVADTIDSHDADGLQHGNLTPEHVWVLEDDTDGVRAQVGGWGILPAIREAQGKDHITPYMAPEQLSRGGSKPTATTDVYGLGAITYYGLTGEAPLPADTDAVLAGDISPPSEIADTPQRLDNPIMRALSRDPAARFTSVTEFVRALEDALSS